MTKPLFFHEALQYAVLTAKDIIEDGAADKLTGDDLDLALSTFQLKPGTPFTAKQVEAIAAVASLGIEYWANNDYADEDDIFGDAAKTLGDITEAGIKHALTFTFGNTWVAV